MPSIDSVSKSSLQKGGVGEYSAGMENERAVYPAIVVPYGTNDNSEQNRIRARIVELDENGKIKGEPAVTLKNPENYNSYGGKDRGIKDENLVLCIPLLPEFFHVRPQVGEMVFVILENAKDNASTRYWIGPIISSKLALRFQDFKSSAKIFNKTDFISNTKTSSSTELSNLLPGESDVALQGRNDADLMLKNREALLVSGKFNRANLSESLTINVENPSFLRLKQFDNINITEVTTKPSKITHNINAEIFFNTADSKHEAKIIIKHLESNVELKNEMNSYPERGFAVEWLKTRIKEAKEKYKTWSFSSAAEEFKVEPANYNIKATPSPTTPPASNQQLLQKFSQATLTSTNINIYSPRGKFRGNDLKSFEINSDLKSFGELANNLHPSVFGDEAVRLFDIIIRLLLTHIHTPQMPLLTTALSDELKKYTVDGFLQNLLSNHIRIN